MHLTREEAGLDKYPRGFIRTAIFQKARQFCIEGILVALAIRFSREARITRKARSPDVARELPPLIVRLGRDRDPTRAGALVDSMRRMLWMPIAARPRHLAGDLIFNDRLADQGDGAFDLSQLNQLAASGFLTLAQADQHREHGVEARHRISER